MALALQFSWVPMPILQLSGTLKRNSAEARSKYNTVRNHTHKKSQAGINETENKKINLEKRQKLKKKGRPEALTKINTVYGYPRSCYQNKMLTNLLKGKLNDSAPE